MNCRWPLLLLPIFLTECSAIPVSLNLQLVPPAAPKNVLELTLSSVLGTDTQQSEFTGVVAADIEVNLTPASGEVAELTFTGGTVFASDVTFTLLGGLLPVEAAGLAGQPSTPLPPGTVVMGSFDASQHLLTVDQGTISAAGNVFDFSQEPLEFPGSGTGSLSVTPAGPPIGNDYTFHVSLELPLSVDRMITVPDVPLFGDVDVFLTGGGVVVAEDQFTVAMLPGDYNFNGLLDCADTQLLGAAITAGTMDATYDANGDGNVDSLDYVFWIEQLKGTFLGDANLDFIVDILDFNDWNANKFTFATGVCDGDFNGDARVDTSDFNAWNQNKFRAADSGPQAVPEPAGILLAYALFAMAGVLLRRRR